MLVSIYVTLHLASIEQAWKLLIVTGAGTGTVLLLRWFWWRINAWSEVSAMAIAAAVSLYLQLGLEWDSDQPRDFAYIMIVTVALTTIAWLAVTWLTAPEPDATRCTRSIAACVRMAGMGGQLPPRSACRPRRASLGTRAAERVPGLRARLRGALRRRLDAAAERRGRHRPARHFCTRGRSDRAEPPIKNRTQRATEDTGQRADPSARGTVQTS